MPDYMTLEEFQKLNPKERTAALEGQKLKLHVPNDDLEYELNGQLEAIGIHLVRQYKFDANRGWKADFADPELNLIVEVDGGTYSSGRHTRGTGYANDRIRDNEAQLQGWVVLRFTAEMVHNGYAYTSIEKAIKILQERKMRNEEESL